MPLPCWEFYHAAYKSCVIVALKMRCKYLQRYVIMLRMNNEAVKVRIIRAQTELSVADTVAILALTKKIWPPKAGAPMPDPADVTEKWQAQSSTHFVVSDNDSVLAHARIFPRQIFTSQGAFNVGALASVCVHPDYRGRGWGADVVRAALDYLPEIKLEIALFQTGVPQFYEKLGCRLIENRFHNNGDYDDVFWDDCAMIYPANSAWPDGEINLNGSGY